MSEPLRVPACTNCGHAVWPARLRCPRCHADSWELRDAGTGTLEQLTELPDAADDAGPDAAGTGSDGGRARGLGSVRLAAGPVVIALCDGALPGEGVRMSIDNGALVAQREELR